MKAYVRTGQGQDVELHSVPIPSINPNEVLVKVKAFGVGIHDRYFIPSAIPFPYVIGSEGSGIIQQKGNQVHHFKEGDRVIFSTSLQPQGGSWASYAAAKGDALLKLPESLDFTQGAALPIAGKTALECMREIGLAPGQTLFIAGASGAIGSLVIQLAARQGIKIAASASASNHGYMKQLGANFTVDYHDPQWTDQVRTWAPQGVDAALAIQPGTAVQSQQVVKDQGLLITVSGDNGSVHPQRQIEVRQMQHHPQTFEKMKQLVQQIADGAITLVIEKEFNFDQALDALHKTESRHARGKVVVRVD